MWWILEIEDRCSFDCSSMLFCFQVTTTKFRVKTSWPRVSSFFSKALSNGANLLNTISQSQRKCTKQSFVSKSHFFASIRKSTVFGRNSAQTVNKVTFNFSFSRLDTPKVNISGFINRKNKILYRRVNARAKCTTRSFRITLARALNWLNEANRHPTGKRLDDFLFSTTQTVE